jgi:hypothetical protein
VAHTLGNSRAISLAATGRASHPFSLHSARASVKPWSPTGCRQVTNSSSRPIGDEGRGLRWGWVPLEIEEAEGGPPPLGLVYRTIHWVKKH